ncbi:hypothetical protein TVAG_498390 [Trichomonas vaginalis G3]|uniref:Uncharacterized protein n=1 Tax=Trichomonas vaginalis (strain ATCC PRA-98 / G3) TaxID=412133 RepID=A2E827_TRIV3|nr:hypothetical protein TVAGG3_0973990 [Trichomonas vaginalis G3]EAY11145.1 hypothetical protein TVAG_498390 [Trichomonas vaginalis G3]KAI5488789.1 hypothetical protein TVAGG3_0973990 [Trichomonas vaginalis G3]|eukprot:XP_001323368.1 hypothetical protein [Trichomonas vaginalis G3]
MLADFFAFKGSVEGVDLFFPPFSAISDYFDENELKFHFNLPLVGKYQGELMCWNKNKYKNAELLSLIDFNQTLYRKNINFTTTDFLPHSRSSQLKCHGKNAEERWCEARRIALVQGHILFSNEALLTFPPFYFNGRGRCLPFRQQRNIMSGEPFLTRRSLDEIAYDATNDDEIIILSSGTEENFNYDFIVSSLLPLYTTLNRLDVNKTKKLYVMENLSKFDTKIFKNILKALPQKVPVSDVPALLKNAVIGLVKGDKKCEPSRHDNERFNEDVLWYQKDDIKDMRDLYINKDYDRKKRPKINVAVSKSLDMNFAAISSAINSRDMNYNIYSFKCKENDYNCIEKEAETIDIFITTPNHGSELMLFMPKNSVFLDVAHEKYVDNRNEVLAHYFDIKYYKFSVKGVPDLQQLKFDDFLECYQLERFAKTDNCRKFIPAIPIFVDQDEFKEFWVSNEKEMLD